VALIVLRSSVMRSKISLAVMVAIALIIAPMKLPAAACTMSSVASEKACESGCCANKACCATSPKKTPAPVQPLTKPGSDQQNIVFLPSTIVVATLPRAATKQSGVFSNAKNAAHLPAPFALICIRLI
jgi:hypothetical protein